jgi:hypothetical protein
MLKEVILSALLIMFISSAFLLQQAMSDVPPDTTLGVEPPGTYGLSPGQSFAVDVTVTNVTDLFAWQFYMYYRSSILNGTSITEGPFLITGASTFFIIAYFTDNYNATHGYMYVSATRVGSVPGANGTGTLATVIFKAVGAGYSLLHVDTTKLIDSESPFGNKIPHGVVDGDVYVGSVDVAISQIEALPNIALGSMAFVNVTAQNRGGFPETFDVTLYYNGTPIETKTVVNLPGAESQVLNFTWDTTPVTTGEYNLTATATVVPGETDLSDNTLSIMVYVGTVDLAITNLTPLKTVVGQGYSTPINVTVANQGQVSGTSNVTAYANQTVIGTVLNITLTSGSSITLTFTWNTTVLIKGNFTIYAYADPLPFEANTLNNNYTSPTTVMVGMPGDVVSPFGVIDMKDIAYVAKRFVTTPSAPLWDPNADINGDGKVDMKDIATVAKNFGKHDP